MTKAAWPWHQEKHVDPQNRTPPFPPLPFPPPSPGSGIVSFGGILSHFVVWDSSSYRNGTKLSCDLLNLLQHFLWTNPLRFSICETTLPAKSGRTAASLPICMVWVPFLASLSCLGLLVPQRIEAETGARAGSCQSVSKMDEACSFYTSPFHLRQGASQKTLQGILQAVCQSC